MNKVPPVISIGVPRLTAGIEEYGRLDLMTHAEADGAIAPPPASDLVRLTEAIALQGRGGAGFPFARKLRAVLESSAKQDKPTMVVVNATEGEPASWKDKVLLTRAPHLILDGAALAAIAIDAEEIVRSEER